jgi:hypothetical protein
MSKETFRKSIALYLLMEERLIALCHHSRVTKTWGAPLVPDSNLLLSEGDRDAADAVEPEDPEFADCIPYWDPEAYIEPEVLLALRRLWFVKSKYQFTQMLYAARDIPSYPGRQALAVHCKATGIDGWSTMGSISSGGSDASGFDASGSREGSSSERGAATSRATLEWRHMQGTPRRGFDPPMGQPT